MHAKRVYGSPNWTHVRGLHFMGVRCRDSGHEIPSHRIGAGNESPAEHAHSPSDRSSRQMPADVKYFWSYNVQMNCVQRTGDVRARTAHVPRPTQHMRSGVLQGQTLSDSNSAISTHVFVESQMQ